jgi:nucleotide-binding universal stress UspA family protein
VTHSSSLYRSRTTFEPYPTVLATAPTRRELLFLSATPRPIFAIGDGSEAALNAAWRAALIAQNWGAPVHLLNARGSSSGKSELSRALEDWSRQSFAGRQISNARARGDQTQLDNRAVEGASLLVTHVEDGCRPFEWLLGTRIEQLVRKFSIPVLIVKQPASRPYRRVLVGVKLDPQASELVAGARKVAPGARVDVVHMLGTSYEFRLRLADASEAVVRAHRTRTHHDAYRQMNDLIAAACGHEANAVVPRIVVGSATERLLDMGGAARAGLIVLGKRSRHWLADLFLDRGVACRVLAEAPGDVLFVPTGR